MSATQARPSTRNNLWRNLAPCGFDAGDGDLYRYVRNDPTNLIDPRGTDPIAIGDAVGGAVSAVLYARMQEQIAADPSCKVTDSHAAVGGTIDWQMVAAPKGVIAGFQFEPNKGCPAKGIAFVQVVVKAGFTTADGKWIPYTPPKDQDYWNRLMFGPGELWVDHIKGINTPYYGIIVGKGKNGIELKALGSNVLGHGGKDSLTAEMYDDPHALDSRSGLGKWTVEFETAAICTESQEVLGVVKWGYEVPDDWTTTTKLLPVTYSDTVSKDFKSALFRWNEYAKKSKVLEIGLPKRTETNCGGTPAVFGPIPVQPVIIEP